VFMKLPPGYPQSNHPNLVCKLHESIYGLNQRPQVWHAKLSIALKALGLTRSNVESSLFV
jgi:hypothetical protein